MDKEFLFITNNMKSYRARAGYLQEQVAELLGVSRATYCDYEVNPQKVKIETFKRLSEIYGCKLSDFFLENQVTVSDNIDDKRRVGE